MKNFFAHSSLLRQTLLTLFGAFLVFGGVSTLFLHSRVKSVVTDEIVHSTENTLSLSAYQIRNLLIRGVSALFSIGLEEDIQAIMSANVMTPYQRVQIADKISSQVQIVSTYLDDQMSVAVVSNSKDIYANVNRYSSESIIKINNMYQSYRISGEAKNTPLFSSLIKNIELETTGLTQDVYVMVLPIETGFSRADVLSATAGTAIVFFPVEELNNFIMFDSENHNTFIVSEDDEIIAAKESELVGTKFSTWFEKMSSGESFLLTEKKIQNSVLSIIDVMPKSYINRYTNNIISTTIITLFFVFGVILLVIAEILKGITQPLVVLSEKMASQDYGIVALSNSDIGRNEIKVLERCFDIMNENISILNAENIRKEEEKRMSEMAALQSQIRPHFLFNTLNTIRCTIMNNRPQKAGEMLLKLSLLLRQTLYQKTELVPLSEEIATAGYYLDISTLQHGHNVEFSQSLADGTEKLLLPKLLLQPLVENAYIHGIANSEIGGKIYIETQMKDDELLLRVKNTGSKLESEIIPGISDNYKAVANNGIGLENVQKRLKLYFGDRAFLRVYKDDLGWVISEIFIPQRKVE